MTYSIKTTVRKALGAAPPGMCVGISDYSAQEVRAISCIAKIERFINAFFEAEVFNPILIRPDTEEEYNNPAGDTHTLAAQGLYPELKTVAEQEPWNLVKEAKKDMGGWNRRTRGKICSFTLIYGGSASRISTALQVEMQTAERLLSNYFKLFPELKNYIDDVSTKARYQKWVKCPVTNRRYFVGESNAKIQGVSAIMTKRAAWLVDQAFEDLNNKYSKDISIGEEGRLIALIHDEVLTYIPGQGKVIDVKQNDKGIWEPIYKYDDISYEYARAQENGMKIAMNELLHPLVPDFPSKADCALGTSWAAK